MESLEEQSKGGVQRILVALPLWSKFDSGVDGSLGVDILGAISWTNDMRGERDELAGVAALVWKISSREKPVQFAN